jgi:hypothetical protein
MGLFGGLGKLFGSGLGQLIAGKKGAAIGSEIGGGLGDLVPGFQTGGPVKRTGKALLHKNEFVLPANAKPTKAQRAIVAKNKAAMRKKGKK